MGKSMNASDYPVSWNRQQVESEDAKQSDAREIDGRSISIANETNFRTLEPALFALQLPLLLPISLLQNGYQRMSLSRSDQSDGQIAAAINW